MKKADKSKGRATKGKRKKQQVNFVNGEQTEAKINDTEAEEDNLDSQLKDNNEQSFDLG